MTKNIEDYIKNKNENRPENIIKGIDPVAVSLVKQIYSSLLDRGENVALYEKIWLREVEKAYKDQKTYDSYFINGLEILLKQAYNVLINDSKSWDIKEEEILALSEKILFLKVREDIYKDFFNDFENVLFSALQHDYTKRVQLTQIGNSKENIYSYKAVMLNTLLESVENSMVTMQSVNEIISNVPGLVCIVTDKEGNIRFINTLGENLFENQNESFIRKSIFDVLPDLNNYKKQLDINGQIKDLQFDLIIKGKSITLPVVMTVKPLQTSSELKEFAYLIKVQQKETQAADLNLQQQLHDKIAPINTLLAGLDLISKKLIDDDSKRLIEGLKNTADRLKANTNEELKSVVSVTKNPVEEIKLISIQKITDEIIQDLNLTGVADVEFIKEIHSCDFYSKEKLVYSILQNLISNAIKYRKQSKKTTVKIRFLEQEENNFVLQVNDNGIGIKKSEIENIFTPSFRVSTSVEGNGLGLHLVETYVHKLKGTIKVQSTFGKGTKFSVYLPNLK